MKLAAALWTRLNFYPSDCLTLLAGIKVGKIPDSDIGAPGYPVLQPKFRRARLVVPMEGRLLSY